MHYASLLLSTIPHYLYSFIIQLYPTRLSLLFFVTFIYDSSSIIVFYHIPVSNSFLFTILHHFYLHVFITYIVLSYNNILLTVSNYSSLLFFTILHDLHSLIIQLYDTNFYSLFFFTFT